jgi:hypothetical protein
MYNLISSCPSCKKDINVDIEGKKFFNTWKCPECKKTFFVNNFKTLGVIFIPSLFIFYFIVNGLPNFPTLFPKKLTGKWHAEVSNSDLGSTTKNVYDLELTDDSLFILNENLFGGETKRLTKGKYSVQQINENIIGITFIHTYVEEPGFTASDLGISNPIVKPGDEIREFLFWKKSENILIPMPPSELEKSMGRLSSYRPLINEPDFYFSK